MTDLPSPPVPRPKRIPMPVMAISPIPTVLLPPILRLGSTRSMTLTTLPLLSIHLHAALPPSSLASPSSPLSAPSPSPVTSSGASPDVSSGASPGVSSAAASAPVSPSCPPSVLAPTSSSLPSPLSTPAPRLFLSNAQPSYPYSYRWESNSSSAPGLLSTPLRPRLPPALPPITLLHLRRTLSVPLPPKIPPPPPPILTPRTSARLSTERVGFDSHTAA